MRGLAFVGNQPSALAVAVKSFDAAWPKTLGELQLLSTTQVAAETARLRAYFAGELPHLSVPESIAVATRVPAPQGGPPGADAAARTWLQGGPAEPVVFFADPGLKSLSLAAVSVLAPGTLFVHADPLAVYVRRVENGRETVDRIGAQDLGIDPLLNLFGIHHTPGTPQPSADLASRIALLKRGHGIVAGTTLSGPGGTLPLHAAYEKGGWLYGLVELETRGEKTVEQMRDVHAARRALWPLQPQLAVRSSDRYASARGESEQLQVVDGSRISLGLWLAKSAQPPLYACISVAPTGQQPVSVRGRGDGNSSLFVWIGPDPSATLNSIYTHRPGRVFLLYDQTTPLVLLRRNTLEELAVQMPVGEVYFVPSDTLGSGVAEHLTAHRRGRTVADITPARVSQAIAIVHLPDTEIWQQEGDAGTASRLDGSGRTDLVGAPLRVQAHAAGGPLRRPGKDVSWNATKQEFFALLAHLLNVGRTENPNLVLCPLPTFCCTAGEVKTAGTRVTVVAGGQTLSFTALRRGIHGGYWFEDLVANRLFASGVAEEARIGIAWSWPPDIQAELERRVRERRARLGLREDREVVRDEVDVAIRLGHRFCAVSCKTDPNEDLERAAAHIGAVAETGFGRFCLAALAHPGPIPRDRRDTLERAGRNLVVLDLPLLTDTNALADTVRAGWKRLSTRE